MTVFTAAALMLAALSRPQTAWTPTHWTETSEPHGADGQMPTPAAAPAQPQTTDRARAEAAAKHAADRLGALQREADALASQESTLLVELRKLEIQRELKTGEVAKTEASLRENQAMLASTIARAASLRDAAEAERPDVEARLVRLYKLGRAGYFRLLLDLDDLQSIGRAYRTAAAMTRLDRERVEKHKRTLDALTRERQGLEARAREIATLQERAAAGRAAIERTVAARSALIDSIDARRDLNAQLTGELEAAQQKLQTAIAQMGAGRAATVTLPLRPFRGALPWPAPGIVTGRFGQQKTSRYGTSVTRNGVEISLPGGQRARVIHEGIVAYADQFTGYGTLVIVDHGDNAYSLYGYLASLEVTLGDRVDAQSTVGLTGRNPAGNPSLYFELRVDGKPVDPLQWLKK